MNETYKKTFDQFAIYLLCAILTSLSFGFLVALIAILFFEDSWGFIEIGLIYALYTFPVNALVAIPFSLFVNYAKKTRDLSYVKKFFLYLIAGSAAGFLYGIILSIPQRFVFEDYILPILFGATSASIFFLIITVLKKWK